ncbi:hypothetical protein ACFW9L_43410 [Streptomyces sp. NPDC059517]|uniref:hypothetical protein n=1 Tax=Streptomyces sp. NPDC059517 TaxID=3346855 RepID=UPI003681F6A6
MGQLCVDAGESDAPQAGREGGVEASAEEVLHRAWLEVGEHAASHNGGERVNGRRLAERATELVDRLRR